MPQDILDSDSLADCSPRTLVDRWNSIPCLYVPYFLIGYNSQDSCFTVYEGGNCVAVFTTIFLSQCFFIILQDHFFFLRIFLKYLLWLIHRLFQTESAPVFTLPSQHSPSNWPGFVGAICTGDSPYARTHCQNWWLQKVWNCVYKWKTVFLLTGPWLHYSLTWFLYGCGARKAVPLKHFGK